MIDAMLSVLAPHYCYGCQNPPKLLCAKCNKYNRQNYNTSNKIELVTKYNTIEVNYIDAREGALKAVIDGYKFQREKSSYKILARMLNDVFPVSKDEIITIIPTSTAHKRERGYDHMKLIGRYYAKLSNATFAEVIEGNRAYSQHKKNYKDRQNLSKNIFSVKNRINLNKDSPIILIDDIYTTGATIREGYEALKDAGFTNIKCRVIAYQPFSIDE